MKSRPSIDETNAMAGMPGRGIQARPFAVLDRDPCSMHAKGTKTIHA
jgi:hypothetical protein